MRKRIMLYLLAGGLFATQTGWADDFATAQAAYEAGDFRQAFVQFQSLAKNAHAQAQYRLGLLYMHGQGVEQSTRQAIDWLKRSAENGSYLAAAELGQIYISGKGVAMDAAEAARWIELSSALAQEGDAEQECE